MKFPKLPDAVTAEIPQTRWGKILSATPVVMTVVATMLAGLASSEMTRAQYDRSLAAQQQSKAGDQWGFFQAKRLRSTSLNSAVDVLQATADVNRLDPATLLRTAGWFAEPLTRMDAQARQLQQALAAPSAAAKVVPALPQAIESYLSNAHGRMAEAEQWRAELTAFAAATNGEGTAELLQGEAVPNMDAGPAPDPRLQAVQEAMARDAPESELAPLVVRLDDRMVDAALRTAQERVRAFDAATGPGNQAVDRLDALLARPATLLQDARLTAQMITASLGETGTGEGEFSAEVRPRAAAFVATCRAAQAGAVQMHRDATAARLRHAARRYDAEARLNQAVANLYEVQVRSSNISADRHHTRSQRFFYGMLAAQAAVIIATFAMAARKRNLLWSLAAAAGLAAVSFSVYVYLCV